MAKAKPIPKPVQLIEGVNLELTAEEARVLSKVAGMVTGDTKGPRGQMDSIFWALRDCPGVRELNEGAAQIGHHGVGLWLICKEKPNGQSNDS